MDLKIFASSAAPLLTTIIAYFLNRYFQHKPRLIAYYGHISAHTMPVNCGYSLNTTLFTKEPKINYLNNFFREKAPLIIKFENDIWIYGVSTDGATKLTKSSSPEKYNELSFTKSIENLREVPSEVYGDIKISESHTATITFGTHEVVVRNSGKLSAKNLRLGHRLLLNFNVIPHTKYEIAKITQGGMEILFPILVPNEQITISYLYNAPVTYADVNTYVKSDEGFAKVIKVILSPSLSLWQKAIIYPLLFIGAWASLYMLIIFTASIYKFF